MPNGKSIIISQLTGLSTLDLTTKVITPIPWLQDGSNIADNNKIEPQSTEWDVSPDGLKIAFTATDSKGYDRTLYVASLEGKDITRISLQPGEFAKRYYLQDKFPVVEKASVPLQLSESLSIVPFTPWVPLPMYKNLRK